jgi:2-phospho-L-lactate guanylyltransferase
MIMKKTAAIIPVSRFSHAKTRLSPSLSPVEREDLLKAMLQDVIRALRDVVDDVVVISSDGDVLNFLRPLEVHCLKEEGHTDLNGALTQALEWYQPRGEQVIIVPSDVPLLSEGLVKGLLAMTEEYQVVIAPSKGGGTNALICPTSGFKMSFGDCSFFAHLEEARKAGLTHEIFDSFYLSLDVNTSEDLGEIMLHGEGTQTQKFLQNLGLKVYSHRGSERLRVERPGND